MKKDDSIEKFLKIFTKEEILTALAKTRSFRRMAHELCIVLYESKTRKLEDAVDRNIKAYKDCRSIMEFAENDAEYKKLNAEMDKIFKKFEEIRW